MPSSAARPPAQRVARPGLRKRANEHRHPRPIDLRRLIAVLQYRSKCGRLTILGDNEDRPERESFVLCPLLYFLFRGYFQNRNLKQWHDYILFSWTLRRRLSASGLVSSCRCRAANSSLVNFSLATIRWWSGRASVPATFSKNACWSKRDLPAGSEGGRTE